MLPLILALIASVCYGVSKVFVRKAADVNPFVSVLYTFIIAPPVLMLFAVFNGDLFVPLNLNMWTVANLALSGIFYLAIGRIFAYASIDLIGASRASQLTSTQVIFAALLSVTFLREDMALKLAGGTVAIFLGELLISISNPKSEGESLIPRREFRRGVALGLVGGFLWGASQIFSREGVRGLGSSTMASFISYVFAIFIQFLFVVCFARGKVRLEKSKTYNLLFAGLVSSFALLSQYSALRIANVVNINPIVNTSPLITLLVSYLLIKKVEFINKKVIIGASAVVIGAILVTI